MGSPLFPRAYEELVNEDIAWLEANAPSCLERGHIVAILQQSVNEYRERGYMEDMTHEGWRYKSETETPNKQGER